METNDSWLRWLAGLMLGTAVIFIILITAGTFDPKPVGELQWERLLPTQTIAAGTQPILWLEPITPADAFSLRLKTAFLSGELDVLYGLVIGDDENYLATAVSPLGYAAIWEQLPPATSYQLPITNYHFPFQTWPHVRSEGNEIWLDVVDGRLSVRINRELMWQGDVETATGRIGLWGESFGESVVVDFQGLQLFAD